MEFGFCGDPGMAATPAARGYTFIEGTVGSLLKPRESEEAFQTALKAHRASPIPCRALNCFLPGDLKVTGPKADLAALERYVTVALDRARVAGVDAIVFGSGGARQIPDGWPREQATAQLTAFGRMLAPLAAARGVTIVVEPLSRTVCNVLTTVGESAALVRAVNHPAFRLLVDSYHWGLDGDSEPDLVANGPILAHVHVSTFPGRLAPGGDDCNLRPFFAALRRAGYQGRVSIEANLPQPAEDLPRALAVMKELAATAS